jgi:hypothetical protein
MMTSKTAVNASMKAVQTPRAPVRPATGARMARPVFVRAEQPGSTPDRPTPQPGPQPGTVFYAGNVYTEDQVSIRGLVCEREPEQEADATCGHRFTWPGILGLLTLDPHLPSPHALQWKDAVARNEFAAQPSTSGPTSGGAANPALPPSVEGE